MSYICVSVNIQSYQLPEQKKHGGITDDITAQDGALVFRGSSAGLCDCCGPFPRSCCSSIPSEA
jgi:hypothetical protein